MNPDKLESDVGRGQQAQLLLENDLIQEFFKELEEEIKTGILTTASHEVERREEYYRIYRVLGRFKGLFENTINTGRVQANMLDRLMSGEFDNM